MAHTRERRVLCSEAEREREWGGVGAEGGGAGGAERVMAKVGTGGEMRGQGVWERVGKSGEENGRRLGRRRRRQTARRRGQAARQLWRQRVGWPRARERGGEGGREGRKQTVPAGVDGGASEADGGAVGTGGEVTIGTESGVVAGQRGWGRMTVTALRGREQTAAGVDSE